MDDPQVSKFFRGLHIQYKRSFSLEEVRWWLEERSRYQIHSLNFLSLNNEQDVWNLVLEPCTCHWNWKVEENIGVSLLD